MHNSSRKTLKYLKELVCILIGNLLIALAAQGLIFPNSVLSGGVTGIAVALEPVIHWNKELAADVIVIVCFILGFVVLGKEFAAKTLLSSIIYPIFMRLLSNVPALTTSLLLASIYTGVFVGVGVGLVFRVNASTGGMDIPPLIAAKLTHTEVSKWVMVFDGCIITMGLFTYDVESVMIGLVSVFVTSYMIDKIMMLGAANRKRIEIISDKYEEIVDYIEKDIDRGVSLIPIVGGYEGTPHMMVMSVVDKNQYILINDKVKEIDPKAFMVVADTMDVKGEGFTYPAKLNQMVK